MYWRDYSIQGGCHHALRAYYVNLLLMNWVIPKKIHIPTLRGNFHHLGRGGGNGLKNVLNLYRMSGEGEGGIVIFLCGGVWIFSYLSHKFVKIVNLFITNVGHDQNKNRSFILGQNKSQPTLPEI